MTEDKNQMGSAQVELRGVFVETAFSNDQVARAIAEEVQLGTGDGECAFLGDLHFPLDAPVVVKG